MRGQERLSAGRWVGWKRYPEVEPCWFCLFGNVRGITLHANASHSSLLDEKAYIVMGLSWKYFSSESLTFWIVVTPRFAFMQSVCSSVIYFLLFYCVPWRLLPSVKLSFYEEQSVTFIAKIWRPHERVLLRRTSGTNCLPQDWAPLVGRDK